MQQPPQVQPRMAAPAPVRRPTAPPVGRGPPAPGRGAPPAPGRAYPPQAQPQMGAAAPVVRSGPPVPARGPAPGGRGAPPAQRTQAPGRPALPGPAPPIGQPIGRGAGTPGVVRPPAPARGPAPGQQGVGRGTAPPTAVPGSAAGPVKRPHPGDASTFPPAQKQKMMPPGDGRPSMAAKLAAVATTSAVQGYGPQQGYGHPQQGYGQHQQQAGYGQQQPGYGHPGGAAGQYDPAIAYGYGDGTADPAGGMIVPVPSRTDLSSLSKEEQKKVKAKQDMEARRLATEAKAMAASHANIGKEVDFISRNASGAPIPKLLRFDIIPESYLMSPEAKQKKDGTDMWFVTLYYENLTTEAPLVQGVGMIRRDPSVTSFGGVKVGMELEKTDGFKMRDIDRRLRSQWWTNAGNYPYVLENWEKIKYLPVVTYPNPKNEAVKNQFKYSLDKVPDDVECWAWELALDVVFDGTSDDPATTFADVVDDIDPETGQPKIDPETGKIKTKDVTIGWEQLKPGNRIEYCFRMAYATIIQESRRNVYQISFPRKLQWVRRLSAEGLKNVRGNAGRALNPQLGEGDGSALPALHAPASTSRLSIMGPTATPLSARPPLALMPPANPMQQTQPAPHAQHTQLLPTAAHRPAAPGQAVPNKTVAPGSKLPPAVQKSAAAQANPLGAKPTVQAKTAVPPKALPAPQQKQVPGQARPPVQQHPNQQHRPAPVPAAPPVPSVPAPSVPGNEESLYYAADGAPVPSEETAQADSANAPGPEAAAAAPEAVADVSVAQDPSLAPTAPEDAQATAAAPPADGVDPAVAADPSSVPPQDESAGGAPPQEEAPPQYPAAEGEAPPAGAPVPEGGGDGSEIAPDPAAAAS